MESHVATANLTIRGWKKLGERPSQTRTKLVEFDLRPLKFLTTQGDAAKEIWLQHVVETAKLRYARNDDDSFVLTCLDF